MGEIRGPDEVAAAVARAFEQQAAIMERLARNDLTRGLAEVDRFLQRDGIQLSADSLEPRRLARDLQLAMQKAFAIVARQEQGDFSDLEQSVTMPVVFVPDGPTPDAMLLALGQPHLPMAAVAAFMIADVAATLGPIPLGLGTFEAAAVATLAVGGVSFEASLAATPQLRGFTFWLPMLPGLWLAKRGLGGGTLATELPLDRVQCSQQLRYPRMR